MPESVSLWIAGVKSGDEQAAQQLWARYSARLIELARLRLGTAPRSVADEEDVALSVFASVCRGAAAGRFGELANRDELWWLLLTITCRKAAGQIRRESAQKRGGGRVRGEGDLSPQNNNGKIFDLDDLASDEPTPELLVIMETENRRLLGLLRDDQLRTIAMSRLEGCTVEEIATELAISTRSVERKLQLIRKRWAREINS